MGGLIKLPYGRKSVFRYITRRRLHAFNHLMALYSRDSC